MSTINQPILLLMNLVKVQALVARRFDSLSLHGIGFSDFMILYLLRQASGERLRRIDLAEKIGLTASGVTRLLLPMEKTGLIKREANERDARVSYVVLTQAGKRIFEEARETANYIAREIISPEKVKKAGALADILAELGGNIK
jgi:DNA-binding MarR family transcriptional regulator